MNKYLSSINKTDESQIVKDLLIQAENLNTPIISEEGINMVIQLIKLMKAETVLEIGSAIGYSAIRIALATDAKIVTIEKDSASYQQAVDNIAKCRMTERITILNQDALDVELNQKFDLLFIDAAKSQYLRFLEHFKDNLVSESVVVCDNLLFHGMVENPDLVRSKRTKDLVKKIAKFNQELINHPDFETYIYEIGDGLSISIRK